MPSCHDGMMFSIGQCWMLLRSSMASWHYYVYKTFVFPSVEQIVQWCFQFGNVQCSEMLRGACGDQSNAGHVQFSWLHNALQWCITYICTFFLVDAQWCVQKICISIIWTGLAQCLHKKPGEHLHFHRPPSLHKPNWTNRMSNAVEKLRDACVNHSNAGHVELAQSMIYKTPGGKHFYFTHKGNTFAHWYTNPGGTFAFPLPAQIRNTIEGTFDNDERG